MRGCRAIRAGTIVYDRPERRAVLLPTLLESGSAELVERMRREGARVTLRGFDGSCRANLVWAAVPAAPR